MLVHADITCPTTSATGSAVFGGIPVPISSNYGGGFINYTNASIAEVTGGASGFGASNFAFRTAINAGYATYANMSGKRIEFTMVYAC
jgi:hypothetical protein